MALKLKLIINNNYAIARIIFVIVDLICSALIISISAK